MNTELGENGSFASAPAQPALHAAIGKEEIEETCGWVEKKNKRTCTHGMCRRAGSTGMVKGRGRRGREGRG